MPDWVDICQITLSPQIGWIYAAVALGVILIWNPPPTSSTNAVTTNAITGITNFTNITITSDIADVVTPNLETISSCRDVDITNDTTFGIITATIIDIG